MREKVRLSIIVGLNLGFHGEKLACRMHVTCLSLIEVASNRNVSTHFNQPCHIKFHENSVGDSGTAAAFVTSMKKCKPNVS